MRRCWIGSKRMGRFPRYRVALSVQASQDQQNNSVKHLEIVQELYTVANYHFTLSGVTTSPFEKRRAQHPCMKPVYGEIC